jgi:hypothetical protein
MPALLLVLLVLLVLGCILPSARNNKPSFLAFAVGKSQINAEPVMSGCCPANQEPPRGSRHNLYISRDGESKELNDC